MVVFFRGLKKEVDPMRVITDQFLSPQYHAKCLSALLEVV